MNVKLRVELPLRLSNLHTRMSTLITLDELYMNLFIDILIFLYSLEIIDSFFSESPAFRTVLHVGNALPARWLSREPSPGC